MRRRVLLALSPLLLVTAAPAVASGDARVAALQVALRSRGFYAGTIDGLPGPRTQRAVRRLQQRDGLSVDGVAGPRTLARLRRHELGSRVAARGVRGWDVAEIQFEVAWHGFPSGPFDGVFGARTTAAVRRFQAWVGIAHDGRVGPATLAALRAPPPAAPYALAWPVQAPLGDPFGPRGDRFHSGIDLPGPPGEPVLAAATGRVTWAGWADGGWGQLVVLAHPDGVTTLYAHLSEVDVGPGQPVAVGTAIGRVGATGDATGPHLHFEVRVRGAAVDPLDALP